MKFQITNDTKIGLCILLVHSYDLVLFRKSFRLKNKLMLEGIFFYIQEYNPSKRCSPSEDITINYNKI